MKSNFKIGIIGGGQLGKMMVLEAKRMGFYIITLDPCENCPSHSISDEHTIKSFDDKEAISYLASKVDVVTYEFEHINADVLIELENKNYKIFPTAKSLLTIQNKSAQKELLNIHGIPIPKYFDIFNIEDIYKAVEEFNYPVVLKTCKGGYDGKGNYLISNESEIETAFNYLGSGKKELMAEQFIDYEKEISVLACRGQNGDIVVYPVAENTHNNNILIETSVPAQISDETTKKAMELAEKVMNIFEGVGMFCIEMFVTKNGELYINEVAPRPHNSGHYTIEGCITNQFENHVRAITGLPLGYSHLIKPTVMRNILGEENYNGDAVYKGIHKALEFRSVKVHIYGKEKTSPQRKMGHLTVCANKLEEAKRIARLCQNYIKVISEQGENKND